jgi:hypothetical protein
MGAEEEIFGYADDLGPEKVLHFYDPKLKLRGIPVVDNTARGPGFGGIRMCPDVTTKVVFRLASTKLVTHSTRRNKCKKLKEHSLSFINSYANITAGEWELLCLLIKH